MTPPRKLILLTVALAGVWLWLPDAAICFGGDTSGFSTGIDGATEVAPVVDLPPDEHSDVLPPEGIPKESNTYSPVPEPATIISLVGLLMMAAATWLVRRFRPFCR